MSPRWSPVQYLLILLNSNIICWWGFFSIEWTKISRKGEHWKRKNGKRRGEVASKMSQKPILLLPQCGTQMIPTRRPTPGKVAMLSALLETLHKLLDAHIHHGPVSSLELLTLIFLFPRVCKSNVAFLTSRKRRVQVHLVQSARTPSTVHHST